MPTISLYTLFIMGAGLPFIAKVPLISINPRLKNSLKEVFYQKSHNSLVVRDF